MPVHIVAPCPKKPSSLYSLFDQVNGEIDDACQELRQILQHPVQKMDDNLIVRTDNPLPHDSSFVPLHQAVSNLNVSMSDSTNKIRPRSFSVGDPRNYSLYKVTTSMVH